VLLALAVYTLIGLMASIDADAVQERLAGKAPERLAGGVLLGLGVLFLLRGIGVIVAAEQSMPRTELAVLVADFLLRQSGGALNLHVTLFFVLLLTLIVTLYDRYHVVYEARFASTTQ